MTQFSARGMPPYHTALRSVFLVAMHYGCALQPTQLAVGDAADPTGSILKILAGAGIVGSVRAHQTWNGLSKLSSQFPAMAIYKDGNWVILMRMLEASDGKPCVLVLDPSIEQRGAVLVTQAEFVDAWSGTIVLCVPSDQKTEQAQPFGFSWFLPEILRQKRYLYDVAIAAVMCNAIGFGTPLLHHVIIDKVIPHQGYNTLYLLIAIFLVATAFEALFGYLRQYLMLIATSKIDASLASRTHSHLLGLPMQYFEATSTGVLTRHMQQTDKVRQFLTGRLLHTCLDAVMLPLLIVLLVLYSAKLTAVVIFFSLCVAAIIGIMIPTFRKHLNQLYQAEGARQSHLVETVHGMRTIKSLSVEEARQKGWDKTVVNAVRRHASVGRIGAVANILTVTLDKTMQFAVLGLGALEVFDGNLTVGALVAFTMLAGRVSGPLIQIVGLINEFQETTLSIRMLGSVMDHPLERDPNRRSSRPALTGELEFDSVSFSYPKTVNPALDRVSFKVTEGQVVGIVGRSGSGKTTITRLIQGINIAQSGLVRLNGMDVRQIDLAHLRRSVGVVLQDSFLFRGTISENIASARPSAQLGEIVAAARLAGADEFIERLPLGYDTTIEEGASNLSGGQRQRIAIARALITKPRLLIFDEATSALDPESESIIQDNLGAIAQGRTMIIVSHRLSSLASADAILVLDRGQVVDFAPHRVLLDRCRIYSQLWNQQNRHIAGRGRLMELEAS